jgi:mRNA interferase MazF
VGLKRGDVIVVALQGDLGKPRPALVVETDVLAPTNHVLVCPGTTYMLQGTPNRRILVQPNLENGLRELTFFQIDKINPARREKCGEVIGRLDDETMEQVNRLLLVLLGLVD